MGAGGGRARSGARLTRACAFWSPSPRPPPERLPHSQAGTPGSEEGPQRLARRAPAGGPRRSPWLARPAGTGRHGDPPPAHLRGGSPHLPCSPPSAALPHSGSQPGSPQAVKGWDPGPWASCRGQAGWGRTTHSSHSVPRDEETGGQGGPELARRLGPGRYDPQHGMFPMSSAYSLSQRGAVDAWGQGVERRRGEQTVWWPRKCPNGKEDAQGRRMPRGPGAPHSQRARARQCPGGPRPRASRSRCVRR